ncbi:hypothetical protein EJ08DRAFT_717041 [Tothia fuscella]|uniref:Uncharacterized protein n=1 Tax=Tothia fuscella TaxID=1048955 RepID=A0A9P4NQ56_9PEZI|nr:hypothetical protein EJ08DRAFT_717041 [Tothia fuscella]
MLSHHYFPFQQQLSATFCFFPTRSSLTKHFSLLRKMMPPQSHCAILTMRSYCGVSNISISGSATTDPPKLDSPSENCMDTAMTVPNTTPKVTTHTNADTPLIVINSTDLVFDPEIERQSRERAAKFLEQIHWHTRPPLVPKRSRLGLRDRFRSHRSTSFDSVANESDSSITSTNIRFPNALSPRTDGLKHVNYHFDQIHSKEKHQVHRVLKRSYLKNHSPEKLPPNGNLHPVIASELVPKRQRVKRPSPHHGEKSPLHSFFPTMFNPPDEAFDTAGPEGELQRSWLHKTCPELFNHKGHLQHFVIEKGQPPGISTTLWAWLCGHTMSWHSKKKRDIPFPEFGLTRETLRVIERTYRETPVTGVDPVGQRDMVTKITEQTGLAYQISDVEDEIYLTTGVSGVEEMRGIAEERRLRVREKREAKEKIESSVTIRKSRVQPYYGRSL